MLNMGKLLLLIQGLLLVAEEPLYVGLGGEAGSVPRKPVPRYVTLREPLMMNGDRARSMSPGDSVNFSCRRSHLNFFNCISSTVFLYEKWETSEQ